MLRTLKKEKRHTTICNNIVVGTGVVVLDGITIGDVVNTGARPLQPPQSGG